MSLIFCTFYIKILQNTAGRGGGELRQRGATVTVLSECQHQSSRRGDIISILTMSHRGLSTHYRQEAGLEVSKPEWQRRRTNMMAFDNDIVLSNLSYCRTGLVDKCPSYQRPAD